MQILALQVSGLTVPDYADIHNRNPEDRPPNVTIGVGRAILSNRISHFLNIKGPSFTVDTACSGSLIAVDVACRYLNTGEITGAIVAGANLYLSPEHNMVRHLAAGRTLHSSDTDASRTLVPWPVLHL